MEFPRAQPAHDLEQAHFNAPRLHTAEDVQNARA
jgi:hypothetical protein